MKAFITLFSLCLFSTVIHADEIRDMSDIRQFTGKTIELFFHCSSQHGPILNRSQVESDLRTVVGNIFKI